MQFWCFKLRYIFKKPSISVSTYLYPCLFACISTMHCQSSFWNPLYIVQGSLSIKKQWHWQTCLLRWSFVVIIVFQTFIYVGGSFTFSSIFNGINWMSCYLICFCRSIRLFFLKHILFLLNRKTMARINSLVKMNLSCHFNHSVVLH